ncbi:regulation of nuclear pre-mRNA domain-containing protein 2-like isoform X2 [Lineus longissimus]|uniref:regulation of nuclear pre-mRNA domain-containing protein 2-like isoform X2 n=1 Tax=Lineus longissimus TaxID=88925 RepID=UPI00315DCACD
MAADQINVEKTVEKKFHIVNNTQDNIQGLSLWIIHHKADAKKIVQTWAKVVKKSKANHRLTLFYLCNDVVQNCKRKNAKEYIGLFKEVLTDAVPLVRHESVRPSIKRMLKIWDERNVYNEEFILGLQELLVTEEERELKQQQEVDAKLLAEFKPQVVVETLRGFRRFETELDVKQRQIISYKINASTSEQIKRLKDRRQGAEFNHQFEDAQVKVEDYILGVERVIKERAALIDLLAMTEHFYELQYGEAKVVANAYKNFGTRVNKQRRHLEEVKRTLPEVMSPLPSPTMDAPSPTGSATPPDLAMPSTLNNQVIDMELDEDASGEPIIKMRTKEDEAYSPRSQDSPPSPEGSPIDLQLSPDTTKEDMDIVKGTSHVPQYSPRGGGGNRADNIPVQVADAVYNPRTHLDHHNSRSDYDLMNDEVYIPQSTAAPVVSSSLTALAQIRQIDSSGDSTPVKDEGDTTPTQDEFPDSAQSNPVDFLTRLINQSKKSTELSPSLLQNLSMLRETVKKQATVAKLMEDRSDKEKSQSPTPTGPSSWAAWKAQKQTVSLPDSSGESTPVRDVEPLANQIHNGRKTLDDHLQKQLEDAARIANAPPPPPPEEHYTLMPDDYGHALLDQLPVPNEALRRLNPNKLVQAAPVHDHMRLSFSPPRLSFSPPQVSGPQHNSPDAETRAPVVIHFNQPKKSILKNSSNITVCGDNDTGIPTITNAESPGLSIPTIGGLKQRPMRPPFPPMPGSEEMRPAAPAGAGTGIRPPGPTTPQIKTTPDGNTEVQNEFINKLKQKTATSLSVPVQRQNSNSNLRTVITVDAGLPPPPPPPGPPPPTHESQQDQYPPRPYNPEFTQPPPPFEPQYDPGQSYPEAPPSYNPQEPPPFDPSRPPPTSAAPPFDPTRPPPFDFSRPPPQDLGQGVQASPHGQPVSPRGPQPGDRSAPSTPRTPPAEQHPYSPGAAPMHYGERRDSFPGDSVEHFNDRREHFPGKSPVRKHFQPPFDDELPPRFPPPPPGWHPPPPRDRFDPYRDQYGRPLPKRPIPPPGPGFDQFFPRRY